MGGMCLHMSAAYLCVCVCLESFSVKDGGRELVHCTLSQWKQDHWFFSNSSLEALVCVWYTVQSTIKLSYIVPSYMDTVWACIWHCFVKIYLLAIWGVSSLIIAQPQVSALLKSWSVDGYWKGGASRICTWSPSSWDMLHVGLEHVGSLNAILHILWVTGLIVARWL